MGVCVCERAWASVHGALSNHLLNEIVRSRQNPTPPPSLTENQPITLPLRDEQQCRRSAPTHTHTHTHTHIVSETREREQQPMVREENNF